MISPLLILKAKQPFISSFHNQTWYSQTFPFHVIQIQLQNTILLERKHKMEMSKTKSLLMFYVLLMLFLLICSTSALAHSKASHGGKHARKFGHHRHRAWQRKPRMNHGSTQGHRNHLKNPSIETSLNILRLPNQLVESI